MGQMVNTINEWFHVPYNLAPMKSPAKITFSPLYTERGICEALELLDQSFRKETDMAHVKAAVIPTVGRYMRWGEGWGSKGVKQVSLFYPSRHARLCRIP